MSEEHAGSIPSPVGPYSVYREVDGWVFVSGQIGLDPITGMIVPGGVEKEFRQVLKNMESILKEGALDWGCCVKTTLFLVEMEDFPVVNALYAERVPMPYPARSTIGVKELPKGARVEMDVVARRPGPFKGPGSESLN
ncbi:MAG: Rid family detoxifying hydrolase [Leptospirales bacterium]